MTVPGPGRNTSPGADSDWNYTPTGSSTRKKTHPGPRQAESWTMEGAYVPWVLKTIVPAGSLTGHGRDVALGSRTQIQGPWGFSVPLQGRWYIETGPPPIEVGHGHHHP